MTSWHGIWMPAATPANVVNRINAVFVAASKDPDLAKRIRERSSERLRLSSAGIDNPVVKTKKITVD